MRRDPVLANARMLAVEACILAGTVLLCAYCAICVKTRNPWPWREIVHEAGDRSLLGTVLYFEHAARELPLDLILGAAVGGSVLFAYPRGRRVGSGRHSGRRRMLVVGVVVVVGTILGGTLCSGGLEILVDNLAQKHTRPGNTLEWGAHWRYHLLSRSMLMLCSFGLAGVLVRGVLGRHGTGNQAGQSIFAASLSVFGILTIVFLPDLDPFRDPVFLGHQVREVFTHVLVTVPMAWAACLYLAGDQANVSRHGGVSIRWSAVAGVGGLLIGVYLLTGGLLTSAASQGLTASVTMLLCPHFFEHSYTYAIVPLVAALVYESATMGGPLTPDPLTEAGT